jgi:hypothetical protein
MQILYLIHHNKSNHSFKGSIAVFKVSHKSKVISDKLKLYSYDAIISVAGGFMIGSVKDNDIFEKYEKLDRMNT